MFQLISSYYFSIISCAIVAYLVHYVASYFIKIKRINTAISKFPMDPKHWLYGHIHMISGPNENCLQFYREKLLRHPRMNVFWVGNWLRSNLSLYHPDLAKQLLKTSEPKPINSGVYKFGKQWIGDGLLFSSGEKWTRNRKLVANAFHVDMLKEYLTIKNDRADVFVENLMIAAENGESFEMFTKVSSLTFDIILRCAFSYESDVQERGTIHPYLKAVNELQELWVKRCFHPLQHFDLIYRFTKDYQQFKRNIDFVHGISENIIRNKKESIKQQTDKLGHSNKMKKGLVDVLLCARDVNGIGLSDKEIQDEVDTFMFAGFDTTSSAISWTLYELAQNVFHQERCQIEIDALMEGRQNNKLEWDDLNKLKYLTMCIKEALRIHCPIHAIERELEHPLVFDGLEAPAGSVVCLHIYSLHHNPLIWKDSLKYNPERFSTENAEKINNFAFLPFSAGPRNCIGKHFAMNEMKLVISKTLRRFTLLLDPDKKTYHKFGLVMKTENGMYMKAVKR